MCSSPTDKLYLQYKLNSFFPSPKFNSYSYGFLSSWTIILEFDMKGKMYKIEQIALGIIE